MCKECGDCECVAYTTEDMISPLEKAIVEINARHYCYDCPDGWETGAIRKILRDFAWKILDASLPELDITDTTRSEVEREAKSILGEPS